MSEQNDIVRRLNFENFIWVVFIVVSLLDIYGDELIKKSVTENDKEAQEKANNLFLFIILVSILVYVYFFYRNYKDYEKYRTKSYEVRLIGSALILIGSFCLLYFLLTTTNQTDSISNI